MTLGSDPMGDTAGAVLLNGNAESAERFVNFALEALPPGKHRDPMVRFRDSVVICTAAWGRGELNDAPFRRRIAAAGRSQDGANIENLQLFASMRTYLRERPVVRALFDEHENAWQELSDLYGAENDAMVARVRSAWQSAQGLGTPSFKRLLDLGRRPTAGPATRPVHHMVLAALGSQVQRAVHGLATADDRHADSLGALWKHFHLASGVEFDPLWLELREELVRRILGSTAVLLAGGDPAALLTSFRFFQLDGVLSEALRRGTGFFGSSAGAMVLQRRVVIFHDRRNPRQEFQLFDRGMGLVRGLQIFPHCTDRVQTEDPANLAYLAARFQQRTAVGLNAGSTIRLEPSGGGWSASSVGDEEVVLFGQDGEKKRYGPTERIPELEGVY